MAKLEYHPVQALPKLAWLASVSRDDLVATVLHGPAVETRKAFFIEGCWKGPFDEGGFDRVDCVFGSGAVASEDSLVFVSPSDTVDSLFYRVDDERVVVSNSLPFVLAFCKDRLDPAFDGYDRLIESIAKGIDKYERTIPTLRGDVSRLLFRNLRVERSGCTAVDKPLPPPLASFEAYVGYLERSYQELVDNIRDPRRRQRLAVFSTQSRGYDTTAVNSIAAKHGFDKVFTCTRARDKAAFTGFEREARDDDGTEIGRVLGFECIPLDRLDYRTDRSWDEALYYAGSHSIQDVNLVGINREVDGVAVLLSGTFGEIWRGREYYEPHLRHAVSPELVRSDLAQHGMGELRLHVGLVFLPFPFIGGQRREDILGIASTPEMTRWRLGQGYDKPIARRIAEERGVPRTLFGMEKLNTTISPPQPPAPLDEGLRARYFDFVVDAGLARRWQLRLLPLVHRLNQALYYYSPRRYRGVYYFSRAVSKLRGREHRPGLLLARLNGSVHCFCANEVADRYAKVCPERLFASHGPVGRQERDGRGGGEPPGALPRSTASGGKAPDARAWASSDEMTTDNRQP